MQTLLPDAVVDYLPSSAGRALRSTGINPDNTWKSMVVRKPDDDESRSRRLASRSINDPFGSWCFIRVYSGMLKTGDSVLNPRTGKTERIGRLLKMHANKREDIQEILAGDICACSGPEGT